LPKSLDLRGKAAKTGLGQRAGGQLVRVLEDWCPAYEGLFLYYPGRRQVPAALCALIDMIREASAGTSRATRINLSPGKWIDVG
jgi:DNA-binding transcriptional LysR family regulator